MGGGLVGGAEFGAGSQMVYGAPGTMSIGPGTMTMSGPGMQGAQSIVGSQMLGAPATAIGMPGQATMNFPGQMMAGGATMEPMTFPGQMMAGGATMATGQAVSTFDALDRNYDGVLSRDELAQGIAQGQVAAAGAGASVGGGSVISAAPVITMDGQQPVTALPTT